MSRSPVACLAAIPAIAASLLLGAMPTLAEATLDQTAAHTTGTPYGFAWKAPTKGKGQGVNRPQAGSTVPVTFSLGAVVKKNALIAPGWPKVRRVDCSTKQPIAGTQWLTRPFGARGLTRSGTDYTYSWSVRAEWGNGRLACREFRIKLTDGTTHSALYRFQPASTNHAPLAGDDSASIWVGHTSTFITGNVLVNDSDPDGDPLTVTNAGSFELANGTLVIAADGDYSYALSEHGVPLTDQFTYHVSDGHGGSDDAVLQVTTNYGDPV